MLLQIFKMKLGIPFLQLFLSSIMFTTVTPCIQGEHQFTENKTYRELSYRLSKDVVPRLYNISIIFFPTMTHFDAKCKIDIEILKTISNISLHSHDTIKLEKEEIKLIMQNKVYELSEPPYYRRDENIVDLYFDQVPPGNYTLSIVYVKNIRESDMEDEGYFKTIFLPETDNQQKLLLVTTIQTIEARKWFPCWGEPEFKATFVISFNHEIKYYIWPTMQSERYTLDEYKQDWMWISFVISYPISTYHVMFILTDLDLKSHKEYISHPSIERYKVDVFRSMWSRLSVANFTQFSEVVIDKILQSEWYHKIHVSITSIDQLAIPTMQEDVFGKWRLIVYKESLVTYNEETYSSAQKREVALTVARGMVHQVIDNAITPSWWSHLWLKKGLAALLHVEILDEIFPKGRFLDLFVVQVQQDCLRLDSNVFTQPLSYEVRTLSEIKSLFAFPIYIKGPVILRMIQHVMGNKFQEIIKNYTSTYQFKSSTPDDLWNMMHVNMDNPELGNSTMKYIMGNCVRENNYPIVNVRRTEHTLEISQYQDEYHIDEHYRQKVLQWIPTTFTTWEELDFNNMTHHWIPPKDSTKYNISVPITTKNGWIILNLQQTGYYRVKYDDKSLDAITYYLRFMEYEDIHVLNRAQIIDDTYYFLKRGEITYGRFLHLIYYLREERDYVAWYPMFQMFRDISCFLPFEESAPLKEDMVFILKGLLKNLSYNETTGEDDLTKWLRREAVRWACIFGCTECQEIANARLKEHLKDPRNYKLSPEWREWTYCKGAMKADAKVFLKLIGFQLSVNINEYKVFDYISCAERPRFATNMVYYSSRNQKDSYSTLFHYAIFVDHVVEHVDHGIIGNMEEYNASACVKNKLLVIIINHLFSEDKIQKVSSIKDNFYFKQRKIGENLEWVANRRMRQIKDQKDKFSKFMGLNNA